MYGRRVIGCETPRVYTPPLRPLTPVTSAGFSMIEFAGIVGVTLHPWQRWFLIHAFELLPSGRFRFRTIVLLVARQNGKSTLSWLIALWFMYVREVRLVLGTAQDLDLAEEIWSIAVAVATDEEANPELADEVIKLIETNGKKELRLANGSRYKVKATSRRAGRGFTGDLIMLDELREHQSWNAWSAITKTTMTRLDALVLGMSNAGDATAVVLRHLRRIGHLALGDPDGTFAEDDGQTESFDDDGEAVNSERIDAAIGLFEWSAPPGCDTWDRDAWAQANPSMNHPGGVLESQLAAYCATDPEWEFRVECLCQWSEFVAEGPFPPGSWAAGIDPASTIPDDAPVYYGVDVSADRTTSYIAVVGQRADGPWHAEVVASRAGTDWVAGWFADRATEDAPMQVAVQARGAPATSLIVALSAVPHLEVVEWGGVDLGNATAWLYDEVKASLGRDPDDDPDRLDPDAVADGLRHLPQPALDVAAAQAIPKLLSDGGMAWDRVRSPGDIAPLVAVNAALWLAMAPPDDLPDSAYTADRGMRSV